MELKKGYKQTEIGAIPEDWEIKAIVDITTKVGSGITPKGGERIYKSHGRPFIRSQNIGWGELLLDDVAFIDDETHNTFLSTEVKENDVFLNITGASIGRSAIATINLSGGNVNQHVCIVRANESVINCKFLNASLLSQFGQKQINNFQVGGNRQGLNFEQIKSIQFAIPPVREQTAIATALSDADALITSLEKLIEKKRAIKQGAMQQLLKPKEGWVVKKLGEIGECIIGLTYKPENVKESGLLVLRSSNIQENTLTYDDNVHVDVQVSEKLILQENDILICVRNGSRDLIGKCALIKGKAVGETFGAFMSVFRSPYNQFVYILFQSNIIKKQIDEHLGATINQITNKSLNSFAIPFPSLEEQQEIGLTLSEIDNEISTLEGSLTKCRMLKQGMMQELLTGKTRLV